MLLLYWILCLAFGNLMLFGLGFVCIASAIGSGLGMAESLVFFIPAFFVWKWLRKVQRAV